MKYQLHPACAAWPQMSDSELEELAADIKANGLLEPITLDAKGLLLDGRNRAEACERAGVTPATTVYAGDPVLFSLSKNKHRRHMKPDQIAMVAATLVTAKRGGDRDGSKTSNEVFVNDVAKAAGVPRTAIDSARTVLNDGAPEEVEAVKTGKAKLRATADKVRARKRAEKTAASYAPAAEAMRQATSKPAPPPTTTPKVAEIAALEKEVWRLKDKLDQLAVFLVKEPPPKAEDRPVLNDIQRASRMARGFGEKRPKDVPPMRFVTPPENDPDFALRKEEFEQWLVRRREALEMQFAARTAELEKGFDAKVKAKVEAQRAMDARPWDDDPRTARLKKANLELRAKNAHLEKRFEEKTGAMPRATFAALVTCLHSDKEPPTVEQRTEAFALLTQWKQKHERAGH